MDLVGVLKWAGGVVFGFLAILWGTMLPMVQFLALVTFFDILTGIVAGGKERDVNSDRAYVGMRKKVMMGLLVALAMIADYYVPLSSSVGSLPPHAFTTGAAAAFLWVEGLSIIENAKRVGIDVPEIIGKYFTQLKDKYPAAGSDGK